jgi:hypothetical protein
MNTFEWASNVGRAVAAGRWGETARHLKGPYKRVLHQLNEFTPTGTFIYDLPWDVLVVVDACRADLFEDVAPEYDFAEESSRVRSVASVTRRWMELNFSSAYRDEMAETVYVCGNPHSDTVLDESHFDELVEVWRDAWTRPGTVPPDAVTNEAIRIGRERTPGRMIVHYMQPHCPFITRPELSKGKDLERFGNQSWPDVWQRLERGEVTKANVWDGYRDNLRLGMHEVGVLRRNLDADHFVVTSDHGNALGEWGVYGHPQRMSFDCLRSVPYLETSARDERTRTDLEFESDPTDELSVNDRLKHLGYV